MPGFKPSKTKNSTGKEVLIRMHPRLLSYFERRKRVQEGPYLFPDLQATYRAGGAKALYRLLQRNGVDATFHCFRVTLTTEAARMGLNLDSFRGVLGHSTTKQTEAYNRAALDVNISSIFSAFRSAMQ